MAAETARAVAERHPALDLDAAYVLGLLHDIGRSEGGPHVPDVRHILDGHRLMLERGFDDCARICLTHSFPHQAGWRSHRAGTDGETAGGRRTVRWGFNDLTLPKWQAFLALRQEFTDVVGTSIYKLLPDIVENTFAL